MARPSNLGIKGVLRGLQGNSNPKKGNQGLLWVLDGNGQGRGMSLTLAGEGSSSRTHLNIKKDWQRYASLGSS